MYAIVIIVCILIIYYLARSQTQQVIIHGMLVNVITNKDASPQTVSLVYQINKRMIKLLDYLRKQYKIDATDKECEAGVCVALRSKPEYLFIDHLLRDFNYENIYEHRPIQKGKNVAYSLDKGKSIMLCLRDIDKPARIVDINTLMFVVLHEVAHIANYSEWGHEPQFWRIFKFLLNEASKLDIYNPVDYARHPTNYCGFIINHNPLFDARIIPINQHNA